MAFRSRDLSVCFWNNDDQVSVTLGIWKLFRTEEEDGSEPSCGAEEDHISDTEDGSAPEVGSTPEEGSAPSVT